MDRRIKDITGQSFGDWVVLSYAGYRNTNKHRYHLWLCRCKCGTIRDVDGHNIKAGLSTSCGCKGVEANRRHMIDLVGRRFGKLVVLEYAYSKGKPYWKCKCDCGNEKVINGGDLKLGKRMSCGCFTRCRRHGLSNDPRAYREYIKQCPFKRLRQRTSIAINKALHKQGTSKGGGSVWSYLDYTPQQLKEHLEQRFEPWMTWDNYGGRTNDVERTWWIDHIIPQSHFKYTSMDSDEFKQCWSLNNLQPMEKIANVSKGARI